MPLRQRDHVSIPFKKREWAYLCKWMHTLFTGNGITVEFVKLKIYFCCCYYYYNSLPQLQEISEFY